MRMKAGEFPNGTRTLRAKIDMSLPNVWLRDPLLYRIRHTAHHHTGDKRCIYPMYDFAHRLSDYIEGITHSICTLEFEVHRPLYDWILDNLGLPRPLPTSVRIREAHPEPHDRLEAQAHPPRQREAGERLGRSAPEEAETLLLMIEEETTRPWPPRVRRPSTASRSPSTSCSS